jgi:general secretion pathway protein G
MRRTIGVALLAVLGLALVVRYSTVSCSGDGIRGARENSLRQNLFTLRQVIEEYRIDNRKLPQTLQELVKAGYLREIPVDPMTEKVDWILEQSDDPKIPGIVSVRSTSKSVACNGTRVDTW